MVNPITQQEVSEQSALEQATVPVPLPPQAPPQEVEEKVEVSIKESIRINPRDFSAFKHALEDFVNSWDI